MVYSFALSQFYALLSRQKLRQRFPTAATAATYMRPRWGLWRENYRNVVCPLCPKVLKNLKGVKLGQKPAVLYVENFTDAFCCSVNIFPIFVAMKGFSNTYFGARYYTDNIMMWLSVNPMRDERPSLTFPVTQH